MFSFNIRNPFKKDSAVIGSLEFGNKKAVVYGKDYTMGVDLPKTTIMDWKNASLVRVIPTESKFFYELPLKRVPKTLLEGQFEQIHFTMTSGRIPSRITFIEPRVELVGKKVIRITASKGYSQSNEYSDWQDLEDMNANQEIAKQKEEEREHLAELLVNLLDDYADKSKEYTIDDDCGAENVLIEGTFDFRKIARVIGDFTADNDNDDFIEMLFYAITDRYPLNRIETVKLDGWYDLIDAAKYIIDFIESDGKSHKDLYWNEFMGGHK